MPKPPSGPLEMDWSNSQIHHLADVALLVVTHTYLCIICLHHLLPVTVVELQADRNLYAQRFLPVGGYRIKMDESKCCVRNVR